MTDSNALASPSSKGSVENGNRDRGAGKRHRKAESPEVVYSKALSRILRHRAKEENLVMRADGYIRVDDLLQRPKLKGLDFAFLQKLVADSDKQRFAMLDEVGLDGKRIWWIKANQGHSIELDDLELTKIQTPEELATVLHGTYKRLWSAIAEEGLKCMTRTYIHCASGRFGDDGVISGVRSSCNLFIYINVHKAMADGIDFWVSPNGVILTKGIGGVLPPKYFEKVVDKHDQPVEPP